MWNPFQKLFSGKSFLGIDIGTSYIKMVQISKLGHRKKLENYGSLPASVLHEKPFRTFEKSTLLLSNQEIATAIKAIIQEAEIKTKQAVFSIPDFSTFFTSFELPPMTKEELPQAVKYEARQHIPLPLAEVTLDWQVIESRLLDDKKISFKILLAAVPNEVVGQYQEIARLSQLELVALEAEVFSLMRSLIRENGQESVAILDIGSQSTTCSIINEKLLKMSHSFNISGNEFTKVISKGLNIDYFEAEKLEKEHGLKGKKEVKEILLPLVDIILKETEIIFNNSYQKGGPEIQKMILAGGWALLPGLKEYFTENLKISAEIANPFSDILYPSILEKTLTKMGPGFAIAVGVALRGLEA